MGRLMGALLLTGGGLWLGLSRVGELRRRIETLTSWLAALELLEGELTYGAPATQTLLEHIACKAPTLAGKAFAAAGRGLDKLGELSFAAIWREALEGVPGGLSGEDVETLALLGHVLGRSGREDQRAALRRTETELSRRLGLLRAELEQKGRAYGATGLALGLFLTILLL